MTESRQSRFAHVRLLGGLLLFHLLFNLYWLSATTSVDIGLPHNHLYQALAHAEGIEGARTWGNPDSLIYPLSTLAVRLGGPSYLSVACVHTLFFLLAMIGVYVLARELADPAAGLLAAALFGLTPAAFGISRVYSDLAFGMAVSAWALWLLWRTCGATRLFPALSLAALLPLGLSQMFVPSHGMLILLMLAGPAAVALFGRNEATAWSKRVLVAGSALIILIVAALLSLPHPFDVSYYSGESSRFAEASLIRHPRFLFSMLVLLIGYVQGPLLGGAFLFGAITAFVRRARGRWFLLSAIVPTVVALTIVPKRKDMNLFALLPALAVLTAVGLWHLRQRRLRRIIIVALLLAAFGHFLYGSLTPHQPTVLIDRLGMRAAYEAPPYPWANAPYRDPAVHREATALVEAAGTLESAEPLRVLSTACAMDDTLRFELALLSRRLELTQLCEIEEPAPILASADLLLLPAPPTLPESEIRLAAWLNDDLTIEVRRAMEALASRCTFWRRVGLFGIFFVHRDSAGND